MDHISWQNIKILIIQSFDYITLKTNVFLNTQVLNERKYELLKTTKCIIKIDKIKEFQKTKPYYPTKGLVNKNEKFLKLIITIDK